MRIAVLALLLTAALVGGGSLTAPALEEPAGATDFDHRRARALLDRIAIAPHPIGSAEAARVRGEIAAALRAIGLAPEEQRAVGLNGHYTAAGLVTNVLARLDPPGRTAPARDALLLVCHSDSRTVSHGAGDDGAGVAALVEVMRALKAGPPLARPVIVLATDGEEQGLLGAEAFVSQHPWAREVALVVNVEARGVSGPALMFELSPQAGGLVRLAAAVAPKVSGTSLAGEVYRRMPNDTDLTVFLDAGLAGMNFAFNRGWRFYHTAQDDLAHVETDSVAHLGRTALGIARAVAGSGAAGSEAAGSEAAGSGAAGSGDRALVAAAPERVYFRFGPGPFVHYERPVALGLAGLVALAALVALAGAWSASGGGAVARGLGATLAAVALAGVLAAALAIGAGRLHERVLGEGDALRSAWYYAAVVCAAAASGFAASTGDARGGAAGALAVWAALALATAWGFTGASYLFAWPALCAAPGLVLLARRNSLTGDAGAGERDGDGSAPARPAPLAALVSVPGMIVLANTIYLVHLSLGNGVLGAVGGGVLVALGIRLAAPLAGVTGRHAVAGACVCALAAAGLALGGAAFERPDAARPDPCWLVYGLDATARRAQWVGPPRRPSRWSAQLLGENPPIGLVPDLAPTRPDEPVAYADAQLVDLPAPAATVEAAPAPAATPATPPAPATAPQVAPAPDGTRRVRLRLTSRRGATLLWLALPRDRVRAVWLDGRALPPPDSGRWGETGFRRSRRRVARPDLWTLDASGIGQAGAVLELAIAGAAPVAGRLADFTSGLPAQARPPPLPAWLVDFDHGRSTVVSTAIVF